MQRKIWLNFCLCVAFTAAFFTCSLPSFAGSISDSNNFASQITARTFYDLAMQITSAEEVNQTKAEQAIIFLEAALKLDKNADYCLSPLFKLISQFPMENQSPLVQQLLTNYFKKPADFEVFKNALFYLLNQAASREQREKLIQDLYLKLQNKNNMVDSELLTTLGLLRLEVADVNAVQYFDNAYTENIYNGFAFSKLLELSPDRISVPGMLGHLRLMLGQNPLDLDSALRFADYARAIELYPTASDAYRYCSELYNYLYPNKPLPAEIYLPLAISDLNTPARLNECIELSSKVSSGGRFDLVLDSIAARAAMLLGDEKQATLLFTQTEKKAKEIYNGNKQNFDIAQKLAWYYCFARPEPNEAIGFSTAAFSLEPNSPMAAALVAYCLVEQKQNEKARQLAEKFSDNQISQIVLAKLALASGNKEKATQNLKTAIAKDPGSLEGIAAKKLLASLGQSFVILPDGQAIIQMLEASLKRPIVPAFTTPDKILSFDLNLKGTRFSYSKDFGASLTVTNIWTEPFIISDSSLFTGLIRLDAKITGPVTETIANLVNLQYQPMKTIEPGRSIVIDLHLKTGRLRQILLSMPQADFTIEFTAYIDPVLSDGQPVNRLADIKPLKRTVTRIGETITLQYLQYLNNSITKGRDIQKISAAGMFAGLLSEQTILQSGKIYYQTFSAGNLVPFLKSGLIKCLKDESWEVRTETTADLLLLQPDSSFTPLVSENLNDSRWPVRLMAHFLLMEKSPDFRKILDQIAALDTDPLVRQLAITFGGKTGI
jgi:hypothetical protein